LSRTNPPRDDELEVSIIGPGRGECVIVHVGNNEWCVVDSCIAAGFGDSVAIDYLRSFPNNALDRIRMVVATHWHDDHIRGLSSLLRRVPTAEFFCSDAIQSKEFLTLLESANERVSGKSGLDEFGAILDDQLSALTAGKPRRFPCPKWAIENRVLLSLDERGRGFPVTITSMSPSDATKTLALCEIGRLLPTPGQMQRGFPSIGANHTSVVLWVKVGQLRVLLGADLLHTSRDGEGWNAILASHRDDVAGKFFKVPHHGSKSADCPEVWSKMLEPSPIAVVTPFTNSKLPRPADLHRLGTRTSKLYSTSEGGPKAPKRGALVDKFIRRQQVNLRIVDGAPGHVRVRWSLSDVTKSPTVELFHGAYSVSHA
jgi:beta-lactamase superfamily II metal-dependent hydrolase